MDNINLFVVILVFVILFLIIEEYQKNNVKMSVQTPVPVPESESMTVKPFDYNRACLYGVCASQFVDNNIVNYGDNVPILNADGF